MPDGQVGFVGKDVATILEYANPTKACRVHVEEDDKGMSQHCKMERKVRKFYKYYKYL
ncbi:MAG: hypothetical protein MJY95_01540 [Bacteroidaceae bacterium]|nr:hypothetical protein [Bacteroidaceae bacterium]